jgi:hypothetical protein
MFEFLRNFTPYDMFCANLVLSIVNVAMIIAFLVFLFIIRIGG